MALNFSVDVKNARLQTLCDLINASETKLVIYDDEDVVLCELSFANPCEFSIENGVLTFKNLPESMVLENGIADNASVIDIDSNVLVGLTVGEINSTADLKLPSTLLYAGSLLRLNGWTITEL